MITVYSYLLQEFFLNLLTLFTKNLDSLIPLYFVINQLYFNAITKIAIIASVKMMVTLKIILTFVFFFFP
jgi:hypothetical protein